MSRHVGFVGCVLFAAVGLAPRTAHAQWYVGGYLGAAATQSAPVFIDVPASGVALEFRDVEFEGRAFESPQYYGWRIGSLLGARRFGLEVEFIHLKDYAKTDAAYDTTGSSGTAPLTSGQPMRTIVERYAMSHGLNFLVTNVVFRQEASDRRVAIIVRGGAGSTIPHTETTVLGAAVDKYEGAGLGVHAAAGLDVQLRGRLSLIGEYKWTYARPEITVAGGTGRTTAATHHIAFGLAFGLAR